MRSGKLDRSIKIQYSARTTDGHGGVVNTWKDLATVRAEILDETTEEFLRTYGISDETLRIFRIRFRSDVTAAHRIMFDSKVHNIKAITEIQRRKGLEIRAVAVGA